MADKQPSKPDDPVALKQEQPQRRQQPGTQGSGADRSALDKSGNVNEGKLQENQERLQVGPDHKTAEMEKKHRGTFP
jgi:hypothetical protein